MSKKWSKKNCKVLSEDAKVYSFAIKCYDEQLINGREFTEQVIRNTNSRDVQILAIWHDRDVYADEELFWKPAIEKPHLHIIGRMTDKNKRVRIKSELNMLGICFRPGRDDELWKEHGVETVCDFAGYATYLTHETEDAIAEGKEKYELDEYISNLNIEEIKAVREGYLRVSQTSKKLTPEEWIELDNAAYNLGYNFGNYDKWYNGLSFNARSSTKINTIQDSYRRGARDRVDENSAVLRTCIFIEGAPDCGKTYAAKTALNIPEELILTVSGGGTGKFDRLQPYTKAIIIDDDNCPNLLNMTDNYICQPYRRYKNNPYWTGEYFVVTSNLNFHDWLETCHLTVDVPIKNEHTGLNTRTEPSPHFFAAESRFFICKIVEKDEKKHLSLLSPSPRGTVEEQKERFRRFAKFQENFDRIIAEYTPGLKVDFDVLIDPENLPIARAIELHPYIAFDAFDKFADSFWKGEYTSEKFYLSPWYENKKKYPTGPDKLKFIQTLSDDAISKYADSRATYKILEQFDVSWLRGWLESYILYKECYALDDFEIDTELSTNSHS